MLLCVCCVDPGRVFAVVIGLFVAHGLRHCGFDAPNAFLFAVVGPFICHPATAVGQNKCFCDDCSFVFVCKALIFVVVILSLNESK